MNCTFAWTTPTGLEVSCEDMHRISLNWFYVLYNQFKGGNQYNQVLLKNQSKEQIEHALHGFQQIDYGRAIIYLITMSS